MKSYSNLHDYKDRCRLKELIPHCLTLQIRKKFVTGSSYEGGVNIMGMNGYGEYTFPNGVMYRGEFLDGNCHGIGELVYKDGPEAGCIIRGTWVDGVLKDRKIIFNDNLEYEEKDWQYCKTPDRRYAAEFEKGVQPAGKSLVTPNMPPRAIPPGHYDSGDGFYNPETKLVYSYDNPEKTARAPSVREQEWIVANCRREPLEFVGPRPDFYKTWLPPVEKQTPPPAPPVVVVSDSSSLEEESTDLPFEPVYYDPSCYGGLDRLQIYR
ncbi:hypothetical protein PYW07_003146 [Mythimna separata]|uniref:MORN repeat-containing protein 5 n=1 Tax=Mythimna separata TaxID=271217 RepID=A0AAD7YI66_MYTSE|nr:hypothetical protein PYW07_003146 [Mythimna separata]